MKCTRFEELLFERLEGALDAGRCEELALHSAGCARCRRLETLLTSAEGVVATGGAAVPDDLTASILALTSERDPLQRTLRQLDLDLPAMASMVPDGSFVADVMTATVGADKQRFAYRAREFWRSLAQRPRFALEAAYLGGIVIFLLAGLPGSPLAGVPDRLLNEIRSGDGVVRTSLSVGASRVTEFSRASWAQASDLATSAAAMRLPRAADLADSTSWLVEAAKAIGNWWLDTFTAAAEWLRSAWPGTLSPAPDNSSTEANNDDNGSRRA